MIFDLCKLCRPFTGNAWTRKRNINIFWIYSSSFIELSGILLYYQIEMHTIFIKYLMKYARNILHASYFSSWLEVSQWNWPNKKSLHAHLFSCYNKTNLWCTFLLLLGVEKKNRPQNHSFKENFWSKIQWHFHHINIYTFTSCESLFEWTKLLVVIVEIPVDTL